MSVLLALSRIYLPQAVKKARLNELFEATAEAFQCPMPPPKHDSPEQQLEDFARFTAEKATLSMEQGNEQEVKARLYESSRHIGETIREQLSITNLKEVMQASRVIYKALRIDFQGDLHGEICIRRCFFSSLYSGEICTMISSLDEGLIAGLSNGLVLHFTQRITEGHTCCRARLSATGSSQ